MTQLIFGLGIPVAEGLAGFLIGIMDMHVLLFIWSSMYAAMIVIYILSASQEVYESKEIEDAEYLVAN